MISGEDSSQKLSSKLNRFNSVRKKNILNQIEFIKNHVNKITEKFNQSQACLKKTQGDRKRWLMNKAQSRDDKIHKILISKSKIKFPNRYYESFTPQVKGLLRRNNSLPRIKKEENESTSQELEKINQKLESSFNRALDYKRSISLSVSNRLKKGKSCIITDEEYRKKLEKIINKQEQVFSSKQNLNDKIVSKLKTLNKKKEEAYEKSVNDRIKSVKNNEKAILLKITQNEEQVENLKKLKEIRRLVSAEKFKARKSSQLEKYYFNKKADFSSKEKILEKNTIKPIHSSLEIITHSSEDLTDLKCWRDAEIYKLKCRLLNLSSKS